MSLHRFLSFFHKDWGTQSLWKTFHFIDCSFIILLLLSLTYHRFPKELWLRIYCCAVRIYPNWKPSGKQVSYFYISPWDRKETQGQKQAKGNTKILFKWFFLSAEIIMVRKTQYYHLLISYQWSIFVFFCFQNGLIIILFFLLHMLKIIHMFQIKKMT